MTEMQANDERGRKYEQQKAYAPGAGDELIEASTFTA
jgi:hypothetical protein